MRNGLFADSATEAYARGIAACLPFMTMGMINNLKGCPALLIASGSMATICLFLFLIRIFQVQRNGVKVNDLLNRIVNQLTFPYIFAVCFSIGTDYGEVTGWWGIGFSVVLALWIIIGNCIEEKRRT